MLTLSALDGSGIGALRDHLLRSAGLESGGASEFSARARHIEALEHCRDSLNDAAFQLRESGAPELAAEELRKAQQHLGKVTGRFTSDQLLGEIFGRFCIGK